MNIFRPLSLSAKGLVEKWPSKECRIFVAMSGGIDSAYAAFKLKNVLGYQNLHGLFMHNWTDDESSPGGCTSESDWKDVQTTCNNLQIPCAQVNFERQYWTDVFEPMLASYQRGLTPNPDVMCNRIVKFGYLLNYIERKMQKNNSPYFLATGHYGRILWDSSINEPFLVKALDPQKDQTFFLSYIKRETLSKFLLPLGNELKSNIKTTVSEDPRHDLFHLSKRKESMGLCFVGNRYRHHFNKFLDEFLPHCKDEAPVKIRAMPDNLIIGSYPKSRPIWSVTLSEKAHIGFQIDKSTTKTERWYVCRKLKKENEIWICRKESKLLRPKTLVFSGFKSLLVDSSMIQKERDFLNFPLTVCVRYQDPLIKIQHIEWTSLTAGIIYTESSFRLVAPGQNIAFYCNDICVGGAVTDECLQES